MAQKKTKKSKKKKHTKRGFILKVILHFILNYDTRYNIILYAKYGDEIIAAKMMQRHSLKRLRRIHLKLPQLLLCMI